MLIALLALVVTIWQLKLQRDEVRLNSKINSLIHVSTLLKDKISLSERIIESMKLKQENYTGHALHVNKELKPLLKEINTELIAIVSKQNNALDMLSIKSALKIEP